MSSVMQFGTAAGSTCEPPRIIAPRPSLLFSARARRFSALAEGHTLGDWLRFLGQLTQAQHEALSVLENLPLPDAKAVERARNHGMPPLPAQHWPRAAAWRSALSHILGSVNGANTPQAVKQSCDLLTTASIVHLEALADRVLRTEYFGEEAALLPFVAAALQVYWTVLAAALGSDGREDIPLLDVPGVCPCCGALPVASVVRSTPEASNLRYLHCSLCNTEWNLVRIKCASCDQSGRIAYHRVEGSELMNAEAMRAETCDDCKSYLKILYLEQAPDGDAVADDLATLALDVLMDAAGYSRAGPNLLFVPGSG